jgi:hypothetical protein
MCKSYKNQEDNKMSVSEPAVAYQPAISNEWETDVPLHHNFISEVKRVYYEPDEDFYNSITIDELQDGVLRFIDELDKKYTCK